MASLSFTARLPCSLIPALRHWIRQGGQDLTKEPLHLKHGLDAREDRIDMQYYIEGFVLRPQALPCLVR